jgi:hypothetical protein
MDPGGMHFWWVRTLIVNSCSRRHFCGVPFEAGTALMLDKVEWNDVGGGGGVGPGLVVRNVMQYMYSTVNTPLSTDRPDQARGSYLRLHQRIIFNMALGPMVVLTMSATAWKRNITNRQNDHASPDAHLWTQKKIDRPDDCTQKRKAMICHTPVHATQLTRGADH